MSDLQEDILAAQKMLSRLRDAFEQMNGTPTNRRSEKALQMKETLREWEEKFGAEKLERYAQAHQQELVENHGSSSESQ